MIRVGKEDLTDVTMRHVFTDIETTGLYPFVHRIVCIGWACEGKKRTVVDRDERGMLQQFLDFLQPGDTLVGYNFDFDYGFLVLRCLKHGVNPQKLISCERIDLMKPIKTLIEAKGVSLQSLADFFGFEYEKTSGKKNPRVLGKRRLRGHQAALPFGCWAGRGAVRAPQALVVRAGDGKAEAISTRSGRQVR